MSAAMREKMRALWSDPVWADRQRAAIAEGQARRWQRPIEGEAATGKRRGLQKGLSVYVDDETFAALQRTARAQQKTVTELVRTYIEWGLENEP